jgi:hypothetical protein
MNKKLKAVLWIAAVLLTLKLLVPPPRNTFEDGFSCGVIVMLLMWLLSPTVSKAYEAYVLEKEARKTPEQRKAEAAAAKVRMDAVWAKWKKETTPKENVSRG